MAIVGRAYVTVRAITKQIDDDIRRSIEPTTTKIGEDAGSDIGKGIKTGIGDEDIGASISDGVHKGTTDAEPEAESGGRSIGDRIRDGISSSNKKSGGGFGIVKSIATIPGLIATFGLSIIQIVGAFVAQAVSLVAAIGPALVTGAAVGAAAYVALGQTIGVVMLGLKTKGRQLDDFNAKIASTLHGFKSLGFAVQQQMLGPVAAAFNRIGSNLLPVLQHGLGATGAAIGDVAGKFADLTAQPFFKAELGRVIDSNAAFTGNFGSALVSLSQAAVAVLDAARPLLAQFGDWIASLAAGAAASVQAGKATGELGDFLERGAEVAKQLGRILVNTFQGVIGIFKAATPAGQTLLDVIEGLSARFDDVANAASGQSALANFFDSARPIVQAVDGLIAQIIESLSSRVLTSSGSGIVGFLDALTASVDPLIQAWLPFSSIMISTLTVFLKVLNPVLQVIGTIAQTFSPAILAIGVFIATVKGFAAAAAAIVKLKAAFVALSATMEASNPVLLAISLAVAAAVTIYTAFKGTQKDLSGEIQSTTQSLNQQTGAITANTKELVFNNLQTAGAFDIAQKYGISLGLVQAAAMGGAGAQAELAKQMKDTDFSFDDAVKLSGAIGEQTDVLKGSRVEWQRQQIVLHGANAAMKGYVPSAAQVAKVNHELTGSVDAEVQAHLDAVAALKAQRAAVLGLNAANITLIGGNIAFQQAIDDARKEINKGTATLNINTQAGRDNASTLVSIASSAGAVTGSVKHQQEALETARDTIIRYAIASGKSAAQAKAFADRLFTGTKLVDAHAAAVAKNKAQLDAWIAKMGGAKAAAKAVSGEISDDIGMVGDFISKLGEVPPKVHTKVSVEVAAALADIQSVADALNNVVGGVLGVNVFGSSPRPPGGRSSGSSRPPGRSSGPPRPPGGPGGRTNNFNINVNNPNAEKSSHSIQRQLQRIAQLGLLDGRD